MSWLKIRAFAILFCASFVLQLAHLLTFLAVFGTGIVFQLVFYNAQHQFYGTKSPFGLECFVTLITVALGASICVENSKKIYTSVNFIAIKHPILFFTLPNTVCTLIFMLSFACISRLFFTLPDVDHYVLYKDWDTGGAYLLCVSYIVYVVVSICYKDSSFIRDRISGDAFYQSVAFVVAALLQAATIFGIIEPILEILKDYLIFCEFQPAYILGYLLLVGLVMGVSAGVLENYAQCVVNKRKAPFYWYENSVESRTCVLQFVALPIHYGFCKPGKFLPIGGSSPHFLLFAIYSSLALMQFSKILYMIIFDHKNLDVVCGYSNRTSARERRRSSRSRSRSPRVQSTRPTAEQEENNQFYEGPTEDLDTKNNQLRQNNRKLKQNIFPDGKTEKSVENSSGFLSFLLPLELPIIFMTYVVLKAAVAFVHYAEYQYEESQTINNDQIHEVTLPVNFQSENQRSISKEHLSVVDLEQNNRQSKSSVVNIESEHGILGTNKSRSEVIGAAAAFPKAFADIHDHVSGDNVHAMVNKISSVKLTPMAETDDIY